MPNFLPGPALDAARAFSRYLTRQLEAQPDLAATLAATAGAPFTRAMMEAALAGLDDETALATAMRRLRNRVLPHLLVRDLAGQADLDEICGTVTALAEVCLAAALRVHGALLSARYGEPVGQDSGQVQPLLVVAMGKFGGEELNVSSDIDLIFTYPEEGETNGSRPISNHEYFTQLGRRIIRALAEVTPDGFVFRVDMRLRPYGDSGALVSSFASLEEYYQSQGREWERYAWIKGRAVTGQAAAAELMRLLTPFIYRKYLDYGVFSSMRALHAQIAAEVRRRDRADNIKTGPGGIREIEFAAQVFQLIRGGREKGLRIRRTLAVLDQLAGRGFLPADVAAGLARAYVFLRRLEHRLQYIEDAQTHSLPAAEGDRLAVARSMGYTGWQEFADALAVHRALVKDHFSSLFAEPEQSHPLDPVWTESPDTEEGVRLLAGHGYRSPAEMLEKLQRIRTGSRYLNLPVSSQHRFDRLIPQMVEVAARQNDPDLALGRLLDLGEAISRRESYLAMLEQYPHLLNQVAAVCHASPWAAGLLAHHPILLDELLDLRYLHAVPDWETLARELSDGLKEREGDIEAQMDYCRHFKQVQTFRLLAQDLAGTLTVEHLSDHLSLLADTLLAACLKLCWQLLKGRHRQDLHFAVIAYGKLGGKELGYASDLDLIFLYDDPDPAASQTYARLAQRLNTWLSSYTPAGVLYETDLRLRPNGASGLLVSSLEAFAGYQHSQAWIWEHQALTRARFVTGDPDIGQAFERIRRDILTQERNPRQLAAEIVAMRQKMQQHHPNDSGLFDVKHDPGGMVDIEFMVQYLVLAFAHQWPDLTANIGNIALLRLAAEHGLIPADLSARVQDAYRELRRLQHARRLTGAEFARIGPDQARVLANPVLALWQQLLGAAAGGEGRAR